MLRLTGRAVLPASAAPRAQTLRAKFAYIPSLRLLDTTKRLVSSSSPSSSSPAAPDATTSPAEPPAGKQKVNKHPVSGPAGVLPRTRVTAKMRKGVLPSLTRPPHHQEDGSFCNPWASYHEYGPKDFLLEALPQLKKLRIYTLPTVQRGPGGRPRDEKEALEAAILRAPSEALQATWLGHASFLVQGSGWNVITDPVFSARASPSQLMGPKRYTPPPLALSSSASEESPLGALPPLHMVLLSHNHYDHCDQGTIARLLEKEEEDRRKEESGESEQEWLEAAARVASSSSSASSTAASKSALVQPRRPFTGTLWVCPLGVAPLLWRLGVRKDRTVELDWWEGFVPSPSASFPSSSSSASESAVSSSFSSSASDRFLFAERQRKAKEAAMAAAGLKNEDAFREEKGLEAAAGRGAVVKASWKDHQYQEAEPFSAAAADTGVVEAGGEGEGEGEGEAGGVHEILTLPPSSPSLNASLVPDARLLAALKEGMPRIVAVPAQHQSARTLFDRNRSLWCGYVVLFPDSDPDSSSSKGKDGHGLSRFYFTGDTGYRAIPRGAPEVPLSAEEAARPRCPAFPAIGQRYGPLDLSALPIGAMSPRFFMSSFHASPADSCDIHRDVRSSRSIGMHWGAFPLTDEPIEEPVLQLEQAKKAKGFADEEFVAVIAGATVGAKGGLLNPSQRARTPTPSDDDDHDHDHDHADKGMKKQDGGEKKKE